MRSLLVLLLLSPVLGVEIDNGLTGAPEVECGSDKVELQIRTRKPFKGKVFVKGHFNNPACRVDYSGAGVGNRPTAGIVVPHGSCDMSRRRLLSPQGMQFSAVVVVSFHPTFITKVDRAFHIKCMYRETSKIVTAAIDVSPLTTELIDESLPMPTCTYTIRADEIDGPVLKYARVGQQVVHRWECQTDMYGILVHSCYITDGQGEKVPVVDDRGCHLDRFLLGDPTYTEALNMAYRESHVFKFADRVAVQFQCQIRLCVKEDGGCNGITPPMCDERLGVRGRVRTTTRRPIIRTTPRPTTPKPRRTTRRPASFKLNYVAQPEIQPPPPSFGSDAESLNTSYVPEDPTYKYETYVPVVPEEPYIPLAETYAGPPQFSPTPAARLDLTTAAYTTPPHQLDNVPSIEQRRTEMQRISDIFKPRVYRSLPDPAALDGDFASQFLYVLDTTEEPQSNEGAEGWDVTRGEIVGEVREGVCLGSVSFALLLSTVVLVLLLALCLLLFISFTKIRRLRCLSPLPSPRPRRGLKSVKWKRVGVE